MDAKRKVTQQEFEFACRMIHIDPKSSFVNDIEELQRYAMQMLKPLQNMEEKYESTKTRYEEMISIIEAYQKQKS